MAKTTANTKSKLLKAASQVVRSRGASQLTLEAVAKEARVSKGGLLYHYRSKRALIEGMIAHLLASFEKDIENQTKSNEDRSAWLEAYVKLSFDPHLSHLEESAALVAAIANDPELLVPIQEQYLAWQEATEASGLDPAIATIVRLAADGLWFNELFDLSPLTAERRAEVLETLLKIIKESQNDRQDCAES
ncbi:MAG: TetR/AcrR family transcriptional regulator [Prochloraceae cyanobacterium]|nr:TetR/AcrR family transcriptional regulator [Prochloraceae cyanobacterium]